MCAAVAPEDSMPAVQLRIATVGNVDAGKSTLTGCLTRDILDDGRGHARAAVLRCKHEQETGRTSSVGTEVMGFKGDSVVAVSTKTGRAKLFQAVRAQSDRTISFFDLAGHERYLKTTIFGLTGMAPDYCMLIVGANSGISRMTREHAGIVHALNLPFFVVVTKIDIAPPDIAKRTQAQVTKLVKLCKRAMLPVHDDASARAAAAAASTGRAVPVLQVSCVTGEGLPLLKLFLQTLSPRVGQQLLASGAAAPAADAEHGSEASAVAPAPSTEAPAQVCIDSVYNVPGVGIVVAGTVRAGCVRPGQEMLLGPDPTGSFPAVLVKSIHVYFAPASVAPAGVTAAFAVRFKGGKSTGAKAYGSNWVHRGLSLLAPEVRPSATWEFTAEVLVLHHQTTLEPGYSPVVHVGVVAQAARALEMRSLDGEPILCMRTGDRALVRFRFIHSAQWVQPGDVLLAREGRAKIAGTVQAVHQGDELMLPPGSLASQAAAEKQARAWRCAPTPTAVEVRGPAAAAAR